MIEAVDEQLLSWVKKIVPKSAPMLSSPTEMADREGVNLYLLELTQNPPLRGESPPPLQIWLRYLVTTWAKKPETAHRMLGQLLFSAMQHAEYEVDLEPQPAAIWSAFGVAPQPAFLLRVPLKLERPVELAPLIREPVSIDGQGLTQLRGQLIGPGDIGIANGVIELPSLELRTRTDSHGRFRFDGVAASPGPRLLRIKARGKVVEVEIEMPESAEEVVIIPFDPFG